MSQLAITDLNVDTMLDLDACSAIAGGINEWIMMPSNPSIPNVYNMFFDFSDNRVYNIAVQPTTINVGNDIDGGGEGGGGAGVGSNLQLNNTPVFLGNINLITGP